MSITNRLKQIITNANESNGKIVGEDMQSNKTRLSKDNKGAVVVDVVNKYMTKQITDNDKNLINEYNIGKNDIIKETTNREIEKILGK